MAVYKRAKGLFNSLPLPGQRPNLRLDESDPISRYAAELEKQLEAEDRETTADRFVKQQGPLPAGTLVAMEYIAIYADGSKVLMGRQNVGSVVLEPGADLRLEGMEFRIR